MCIEPPTFLMHAPVRHKAWASHRKRAPASRTVRQVSVRCISPHPACLRARFVSATLRFIAACKPRYSIRTGTSPLMMAWSIRSISRPIPWSNSEGRGIPRPAGEHGLRPAVLLRCPDDGHDLDPAAAIPERLPEFAVRRAPGAECRRCLVARIEVDENGAPGVQRDRQPEREAGISLRKSR